MRSPTKHSSWFARRTSSFLFDPSRKLFSIGFRVRDGTLDPSSYDLLASEARLASFLAIAKGDIAPEHWFRLGRALTPVGRGSALISWSGSMFEYLMPALVMRAPAGSLLDHTYRLIVARQMSYAVERGVPWGISESAFNARDLEQTYQYSSFGVPGLGLKRGLSEDVVVAPYATALGAMIQPAAAVRNFDRLTRAGAGGRYGFREALDYTARRLPEGASVAIVKSYMAHHQGMSVVALGNVLNDYAMVQRFHADPIVEATELLLRGADAAGRARRAAARRRGEERRRCPRSRPAGPAPVHLAPRRDSADASPVERAVCGHGDRRRIRLQPLARRGGDALAGGRDARLMGQLSLPARYAQRRGVVGRAISRAASKPTATRSTTPRITPSSRAATARSRRA